ncbi:hypothetical protein BDP81DRAFT_103884 [Colletotrichum phormii]|uniref:Uncharacterized protein n=1 Tax=Colletotrichum phormii TaxID=359342 RepID=A0AAJ0EBE0_9PEZI|nr:uncharacterized protein BDP81DRAFT_103884 [Colletotrichum phormii]KAK1624975.1 hypothetical protein BDP81DRAFT_103884 [Colletotrichum phormii]
MNSLSRGRLCGVFTPRSTDLDEPYRLIESCARVSLPGLGEDLSASESLEGEQFTWHFGKPVWLHAYPGNDTHDFTHHIRGTGRPTTQTCSRITYRGPHTTRPTVARRSYLFQIPVCWIRRQRGSQKPLPPPFLRPSTTVARQPGAARARVDAGTTHRRNPITEST